MSILDLAFKVKEPGDFSKVVLDKNGKILAVYLNQHDKWRMKVKLNEISPYFLKAIITKEDQYFYYHFGCNPFSIARALLSNAKQNKRVSGASTITMQLVRLLYPNKRTYWSKIKEILRAFQLELHFSKDEILEMYCNLIPFGSNVEGIKSASFIYLQKQPKNLNLSEALTFSLLPNKPRLLHDGKVNNELQRYKNQWLNYYQKHKIFNLDEINFARYENIRFHRMGIPNLCPHLSNRLVKTAQENYIKSTVDLNLQKQTETLLKNFIKRNSTIGLQNAMAVIVDNKTMNVLAYCGSVDYHNINDGGQVDGIRAIRSPGSALKPYLYAKAFQSGLINPLAVTYDVPMDFNGFVPENFDKTYKGEIRYKDALQLSLNVPAVQLLESYSLINFINDLKKAKFSSIEANESKLGLSTILGGCGVKMEEMVALYAAFANYGNWRPLNFTNHENMPIVLTDSASTYIISEILSGILRPDFPNNFEYTYKLPKIAWKTGTSFGKRDAWAIGYNPNYTIGVWLGNFNGESIPNLSGATAATPLLFELFNITDRKRTWFKMPKNIIYRSVCSISGKLPNNYCTNLQTDLFVKGVFYKEKCNHLNKIWVHKTQGYSFCDFCFKPDLAIEKTYKSYPLAYIMYRQSIGLSNDLIPPHNPNCFKKLLKPNLEIHSPRDNGIYFISGNDQIELKAMTPTGHENLQWYHNHEFLGSFKANKSVFITPILGSNTVSCTNELGDTRTVRFEIKKM